MQLRPEPGRPDAAERLDPRTGALVRLAALVAVDASTTTLRWAVELAACSRAADDDIAHVLATVAPVIGYAGVDRAAPRLALALGYDIDIAK